MTIAKSKPTQPAHVRTQKKDDGPGELRRALDIRNADGSTSLLRDALEILEKETVAAPRLVARGQRDVPPRGADRDTPFRDALEVLMKETVHAPRLVTHGGGDSKEGDSAR